ncbi:MAG: acyl-CoA thioester hydrolase [Lachnospiraceae bacterium]|nr:acyl-CoA thioester hydrolase [Lachnospiraceae bacterium]
MERQYFSPDKDGFYGVYYPLKEKSNKVIIAMIGDSSDDRMAVSAVKWLHRKGCNVLAMSPDKQDYGHHNYPLERFERAIAYLKAQGNKKIGIAGASTTGMLALVAASYFPDITLTITMCPCDFIMEGFYQDGKDGVHERPGDNESSVSYRGEPLPYLPYAYRHPEYWQKIKQESKDSGNMIASRNMFIESERLHPVQECEKIKIENIKGKAICIGAEDDALWETTKYIRRMEERLKVLPHECEFTALTYEHGTHFVFPQSMLDIMLPFVSGFLVRLAFKAGRQHPKECKKTRLDIDWKLTCVIKEWVLN